MKLVVLRLFNIRGRGSVIYIYIYIEILSPGARLLIDIYELCSIGAYVGSY